MADVTKTHKLFHGREDTICGDSGYTGADKPSKVRDIKHKGKRAVAEDWEYFIVGLRAKVEHPFRAVKRQFGYTKVRYRGLAKNTIQVLTPFALSNL